MSRWSARRPRSRGPATAARRRAGSPTRRGGPCRHRARRARRGCSYSIHPPRRCPRVSQRVPEACSIESGCSRSAWLRSGDEAYARTPAKPWMACSAGMSSASATSGSSGTSSTRSSSPMPSGSFEPSARSSARTTATPSAPRRSAQKPSAAADADAEDDGVDHPVAGAAATGARVLEERQVVARRSLLVAVEEVVDGRVVLVDGLLHQAHADHARVEVDVPAGVAGDGRDVVKTFKSSLHAQLYYGSACRTDLVERPLDVPRLHVDTPHPGAVHGLRRTRRARVQRGVPHAVVGRQADERHASMPRSRSTCSSSVASNPSSPRSAGPAPCR